MQNKKKQTNGLPGAPSGVLPGVPAGMRMGAHPGGQPREVQDAQQNAQQSVGQSSGPRRQPRRKLSAASAAGTAADSVTVNPADIRADSTAKKTAKKTKQAAKSASDTPAVTAENRPPVRKKPGRKPKNQPQTDRQQAERQQADRRSERQASQPAEAAGHRGRPKNNSKNNVGGPVGGPKLRIIPLGGLNEIGKNMTVVEYGDDIIVIDCGLGFPEEDMLGIDLVIPDITYLEDNRDKIRGIFLTHGHEDHIGAIPYVLRSINPPIYGTKLTLGIIKNKLTEFRLPWEPELNVVSAGDTVRAGVFSVEFIRVNHSIADACCLAINTPRGMLVHTGDFKLDLTPIEGEMMDIPRLGEIGNRGVLLLMCESTNAERPGYTPSERKVGQSLEYIFTTNPDKRIVIATFSSNVHRVQQIIDISARHGRRVAVTGRSMLNIVGAAQELGYMNVPAGVLVDINDIKRYKPEQLTLITTGSQGEPMSALYRMAFSDHSQVTLGAGDLVVLSSSAIPGNEKTVSRVINELCRGGVHVLHDTSMEVHVSGHACQEELKLMQALVKPRYFMPVHGEYRHMTANRELALSLGIDSSNIFISEIGRVLEIDRKGARFAETVPAGNVLVDGDSVGDIGNIVLRDRKHLSEDGLVVVVASVDLSDKILVSGPEVVSRGFVYVRESEELMDEVREVAINTLFEGINIRGKVDRVQLKNRVRDEISRFLSSKTKRKPMVLPIIMYV
ncbi:MAG: ribonuclease J [Eubacteriales bacterium]|nr:ribonuclease J [Eubacteriales bacterium]